MLQACRDTPHPATKKTPYELMINREVNREPSLSIIHQPFQHRIKKAELITKTTNSASRSTMTGDTERQNFTWKLDKQ